MGLLFRKKVLVVPTLLGSVIILFIVSLVAFFAFRSTYSFLAMQKTPKAKILVVEGWIDQSCVKNALELYAAKDYAYLIVTGVPITQWTYSSPFTNMADATEGIMKRLKFQDTIYKAIAPSNVLRDRTYSTAVALKMKFEELNLPYEDFDLYTVGAHSRRSYQMYRKAFKDDRYIGLIADVDPSFDPVKWYTTSRGFRIVLSELISYLYSSLFFHPDEDQFRQLIIDGNYSDEIRDQRAEKDVLFADSTKSPLNKKHLENFIGLNYFPINQEYRLNTVFKVDTSESPFRMQTTTERQPLYRKYGLLSFMLHDTLHQLNAYQNLDYLAKNPDYRHLFIPFKDLTYKTLTYGGGRYLDIDIPESNQVVLDFNLAYNPYCAYDDKWSCPLILFENYLNTDIMAGEMKFNK